MLIGVLVLVALLLIALAVAAPRVAVDLQRDKEDELMHRGMQYPRAIRLYFKKFGRYPNSLDQLEKTNEIRFLRKRYKDPVTGKDEWRLIHFGEALVKPTGLFGQPLTALGTAGAALGANPQAGIMGGSPGSSLGSGASSSFGSSPGLTQGSMGNGSTDSLSGSGTGTTTAGAPGATDPGTTPGSTFGSATSGATGMGGAGQTFGGGGIVGVASTSPKASIREYHKQKHYNEWEFVYDPLQEQNGQNGTGILQQPGASNPNTSIGSPGSPGSNSPGGAFGGGTSPTPSPSPTP